MSKKQMRINPLPDKPGFAAWFDGTIRITDPSYVTSRFPGVRPLDDLTVTIKEDGLWEITTTLMDRAPDQRTGSLVMRRVAANPKPENTKVVLLGKAGVDTGHIAIVAEKFGRIDDWDEYSGTLLGSRQGGGETPCTLDRRRFRLGQTLLAQHLGQRRGAPLQRAERSRSRQATLCSTLPLALAAG